jgi:hypothetical protein
VTGLAAYWLSFAEAPPPEGRGYIGAVLIRPQQDDLIGAALMALSHGRPDVADDPFLAALAACNRLGLNPGGECQGIPLPEEELWRIPAGCWEQLLTRSDLEEAGLLP